MTTHNDDEPLDLMKALKASLDAARLKHAETMTTSNDDAVREVTRKQRADRRNTTRTPRNDKPTKADLTRELHLMETQAREHGYPGTRAVLDLIGELRKEVYALKQENARLRAQQPCGCSRRCGDDADIDGPGVCKGLPRMLDPLIELTTVHRAALDQRNP